MAEQNSLRISLLGTSFTIQTDEDPAYLTELLHEFKEKVSQTRNLVDNSDPLKIAIVTGVLILDELQKERIRGNSVEKMTREAAETEKITEKLISMLEKSLGEESGAPD